MKGMDLRDAIELELYFDATRWFHRRPDGVLVARRWDTWDEVEIDEGSLALYLRKLPLMFAAAGDRPGDGMFDESTSADDALIHAIEESGRKVIFIRQHPAEVKGFGLWIPEMPPPPVDEYGRPLRS